MTDAVKPGSGSTDDLWNSPRSVQSATGTDEARAGTPGAKPPADDHEELKQRVQELLDQQINPAIASHGGHIGLVEVRDNRVYVRMSGGCQGCGAARITLKAGVERVLREEIPEIEEVIDATDHSLGASPYYAPPGK